jgi:hypothetical protein
MGHAPPCTPSKLQLTEEILDICPEGLDRFRIAGSRCAGEQANGVGLSRLDGYGPSDCFGALRTGFFP